MPRSADQTRQKILQTAYKLFRRSGFFRVGVDEIANAARITKRTLYYIGPSQQVRDEFLEYGLVLPSD